MSLKRLWLFVSYLRSIDEDTNLKLSHPTAENLNIQIIVGGGIKTPKDAASKIEAGATIVVTGSIFESPKNKFHMKHFSDAIHRN